MATRKSPSPSIGSWACNACSFLNVPILFPTCEMCHSNNAAPEVTTASLDWSCPTCTFHNHANTTECDVCGSTSITSSSNKMTHKLPETERHSSPASAQQKDDASAAERTFNEILTLCQRNGKPFTDNRFPPTDMSLDCNEKNTPKWLRIRDIVCSDTNKTITWTVTRNPQPSDIEQGHLGDCWLMAALALITQRPRMLSHILLTSTVNEEAIYLVRICHNGLWKTVLLDDRFPCTDRKHLAFTKARRHQLFAPLIEKACAKIFGSYRMLERGSMREALHLLTGAPSDRIHLDEPDDEDNDNRDLLWTKLVTACEAHLIMGVSTGRTDVSVADYAKVHLHGNHVYSVQAAHDLSRVERFVMLRNPHARSNYVDDRISTVTLETLQQAYQAETSAGSFWMSWMAFQRFFATLTICSYRDDLFDVRIEGNFTPHAAHFVQAYYFHLDRLSTITVGLFHQRSDRKRLYANHTQSFVLCDLVDHSRVGDQQAILRSRRKAYTHWTGTLPLGSYVLIPFSASYWNRPKQNDDETKFTLVIHSFTRLDLVIVEESGKLLADSLIAAVMKNSRTPKQRTNCIFYKSKRVGDTSAFVVENTSPDRMLNVDVEMTESAGIRSSRNSITTIDCIPPKHRQLLFLMEDVNESEKTTCPDHPYRYTYKHTSAGRRSPEPMISRADDIHAPRPFL